MTESTSSSHAYRIDPLLGAENYAVWKIKMIDILTDQGYIDIVDGSDILPIEEDEVKLWKKKDRAALSMIRLRIADKMLIYVASSTTLMRSGASSSRKSILQRLVRFPQHRQWLPGQKQIPAFDHTSRVSNHHIQLEYRSRFGLFYSISATPNNRFSVHLSFVRCRCCCSVFSSFTAFQNFYYYCSISALCFRTTLVFFIVDFLFLPFEFYYKNQCT